MSSSALQQADNDEDESFRDLKSFILNKVIFFMAQISYDLCLTRWRKGVKYIYIQYNQSETLKNFPIPFILERKIRVKN